MWEFKGTLDDMIKRRLKAGIPASLEKELNGWGITLAQIKDGSKVQKL